MADHESKPSWLEVFWTKVRKIEPSKLYEPREETHTFTGTITSFVRDAKRKFPYYGQNKKPYNEEIK
ncbi:hypothetical protein HN604_00485 [archaeon]|jgi:hypothetical protein|nr:hypothetical protein [archaeon]MBT6182985.1 hypothetical protein [archaeon]MBT6606642.1 hypothetical protein [archaeon]MBT7251885.1 hypothetical protein [archaeon]MBT7660543.1 hypothetical protein [archaeon]